MTLGTAAMLWLILLLASVLVGMAVAHFQDRARRRKIRARKAPVTNSLETVYSAFGEDVTPGSLDIDPLQEAELYLAYGNKRTAIAVLEKAAQTHPDRQDIQARLTEVRADTSA